MKKQNMMKRNLLYCFIFLLSLSACVKTEPDIYGDVFGFVTDVETSLPVQSAEVTLSRGGETVLTGSDGRYEFNGLEAGQYTLQVSKSKYQISTKNITINPGTKIQTDILLQIGFGNLYIDKTTINFGNSSNQKIIELSNTGNNSLEWNISTDCNWITEIIPNSGSLAAQSDVSVILKIDRSKLSGQQAEEGQLLVSSNGKSTPISVSVNKNIEEPTKDIVVTDGLLLYYNFNDETVTDSSGANNNGRLVNSPEFTTDTPDGSGMALSLKAPQKQYMVIPNNPFAGSDTYTSIQQYSISFWTKDLSTGMIYSLIGENTVESLPYFFTKDNTFFMTVKENGAYSTFDLGENAQSCNDGKWHMLTYVVKDGVHTLYVDAQKFAEKAVLYPKYQLMMKNSIHFGGDGGFSSYRMAANMKLDNIRFHNIALTAFQLESIYKTEKKQ